MTSRQTIDLQYGSKSLTLELPEQATVLTVEDPPRRIDADRFSRDLDHFLDRHPLDLTDAAVVVADKTRLCEYDRYLPVLIHALEKSGADERRLTFYIAYGTHPRQSDATCRRIYGEAYDRCRFVHHDCSRKELFRQTGNTPGGTAVYRLNSLERASAVITFGAISHHYFAGYGGGRKLLFPGLGYRGAIYHNHALFLERAAGRLAPGCRAGALAGNPLAEDLAAVDAFAPADLAIHGLLNSRGRVCDLMVGRGREHFQDACQRHGRCFERSVDSRYDRVVASCGGFPKDINFIQSHKALHNAAEFVRDGGELILLAECRDGIGSETFLPWFKRGGWDNAFKALARHYVGNGGTALAMMAKTRRIRIHLVTRLARNDLTAINCRALSPREVPRQLDDGAGSLAVIPNASMLVGVAPTAGS